MIKDQYFTKDGRTITVTEETKEHLKAHPEVESILEEVLLNVELPQDKSVFGKEIDMGRIVGKSGCVKTQKFSSLDTLMFAQRGNRSKPSRVVIDMQGDDTSTVVIWAKYSEEENAYVLCTAYVGRMSPVEPWDKSLETETQKQESLDFWCEHALVYQKEVMEEPFPSSWEKILHSH